MTQSTSNKFTSHIPVLLTEILDVLHPEENQKYLDLTAGYGGHAAPIIDRIGPKNSDLIDQDANAIQHLKSKFPSENITHSTMGDFLQSVKNSKKTYDLILADIGISSPHVDDPNRGFSFMSDGPLDMRMNQQSTLTAADIINSYSKEELADIFFMYGEERRSRHIANIIVGKRPFNSTLQLATFLQDNLGYSKKHPATKIFQALRIAVNDELGQLKILLSDGPKLLSENGKLAIISFHSLEDRMIKQVFNDIGQDTLDSEFKVLTKKPIVPSKPEIVSNPRARSAKLRVLQRK